MEEFKRTNLNWEDDGDTHYLFFNVYMAEYHQHIYEKFMEMEITLL